MEQEILQGLVARGVSPVAAQGIVSRMRAESGLNPGINERSPVVPGSRGGFGLNQWTGPRRVQLEQFAADRGMAPSDLGTQLDFTVWELNNTERKAGDALRGARSPEEAARIYMMQFLRPGIVHADMRGGDVPVIPPFQNALAAPQPDTGNALGPFRLNLPQRDLTEFAAPRNLFRNYMG